MSAIEIRQWLSDLLESDLGNPDLTTFEGGAQPLDKENNFFIRLVCLWEIPGVAHYHFIIIELF